MAPAQSKLARSSAALASLPAKGGVAAVATLLALVYLRSKVVQAAKEAEEKRAVFLQTPQETMLDIVSISGNRQILTTPQIELAQRDLFNPYAPCSFAWIAAQRADHCESTGCPAGPASYSYPREAASQRSSSARPSPARSPRIVPSFASHLRSSSPHRQLLPLRLHQRRRTKSA